MVINNKQKIVNISLFVALASVLQIMESVFPHPIPGLKLGLANIITLVTLILYGFKESIQVAIYRTLLSSFIMGSFLTPGFILSITGSITSTIVMWIIYNLSLKNYKPKFSIIGISIFGAITHNFTQLAIVYFFLAKHNSILWFLPWLGIGGIIMGYITGLIAQHISRKILKLSSDTNNMVSIKNNYLYNNLIPNQYVATNSIIHRASPELKIVSFITFSVIILLSKLFWHYILISVFLLSVFLLSKINFKTIISDICKLLWILPLCFILPLFFTKGKIMYETSIAKITYEGLYKGSNLTLRMIFILLSSNILLHTTTNKELISGMNNVLYPLKVLGLSVNKLTEIFNISLNMIPFIWYETNLVLKKTKLKKKIVYFIPIISYVIINVYKKILKNYNYDSYEIVDSNKK